MTKKPAKAANSRGYPSQGILTTTRTVTNLPETRLQALPLPPLLHRRPHRPFPHLRIKFLPAKATARSAHIGYQEDKRRLKVKVHSPAPQMGIKLINFSLFCRFRLFPGIKASTKPSLDADYIHFPKLASILLKSYRFFTKVTIMMLQTQKNLLWFSIEYEQWYS